MPSTLLPGAAWSLGNIPVFPANPTPTYSSLPLQPTLRIGSVDDPLEREADHIADQVINLTDAELSVAAAPQHINRKCAACEQGDVEEATQANVQTKTAPALKGADSAPATIGKVICEPGQPLDEDARAFFEPRFGHDFSLIRVHSDTRASEAADAVGALAYTIGRHIVFRKEQYSPQSQNGRRLLAHELAHTIQQTDHRAAGPGLMQRQPDSASPDATSSTPTPAPPAPPSPMPAATAPINGQPAHYRFEIKAWIPFSHVPDPEEPLHDMGFRLQHGDLEVQNYISEYRGDSHPGYDGGHRVLQVVEFDWNGTSIINVNFPTVAHFGTSHRDFSVEVKARLGFDSWRSIHDEETATTDHAVTGAPLNQQEVDVGMSSPNPLTIAPAPDIDADYSIFISQDTFGIETVTVRWSTDFMPNHGFRVFRNGVLVKERIVLALPSAPSSPEIFLRLNSKSNGGAETFEPNQ